MEVTLKGIALSMASAKPISRNLAEKKLKEFIERVKVVNVDSFYILKVTKVVLFGSFLSDKEKIGDIDLAVELRGKEQDPDKMMKLREAKIESAIASGKNFSGFMDQISWPHTEVNLFLKSRSKGLSLHVYETHKDFFKNVPHKTIYSNVVK